MEVLLLTLVRAVVNHESDVKIRCIESEVPTYEIEVHPSDVGCVIGKQGRIINAIRIMARAAARQREVLVELVEDKN